MERDELRTVPTIVVFFDSKYDAKGAVVKTLSTVTLTKMASLHELKGKTDKNFIASEHTTMITREYADNNDNNMKHSKHPKNNIE
jgi:hypothetical protein